MMRRDGNLRLITLPSWSRSQLVKIAFRRKHQSFQDLESSRLKQRLAEHEFYDWIARDEAPADDLDVLFIVGSLDRPTIVNQSPLFFIQTASAGYDGIDVDAATESGIWVSSAPAGGTGNAISVAELAVMLMIGASRRLNLALASVRDHGLTTNHVATALYGKTACIVGLGSVGRAIVERLGPFGMALRGTDAHPEHAPHGVQPLRLTNFTMPCALPITLLFALRQARPTKTSSTPRCLHR